MVTDTLYVPACHVAAFVMVIGVPVVPDVIPGPDHKNVGVPDAAVVALNVNALPLQIGEFDDGLGGPGGLGSDNVNGPTLFDGQPLIDKTYTLVYNPAPKLVITIESPTAVTLFNVVSTPLVM
jgi:hypothetical protein